MAKQADGVLIDDNFHFVDARLKKEHLTRESGSLGTVKADNSVQRAVHGAFDGARHGNQIIHERVEHNRFSESRGSGHRSPLNGTAASTLPFSGTF